MELDKKSRINYEIHFKLKAVAIDEGAKRLHESAIEAKLELSKGTRDFIRKLEVDSKENKISVGVKLILKVMGKYLNILY